jgi:hypothetical protein
MPEHRSNGHAGLEADRLLRLSSQPFASIPRRGYRAPRRDARLRFGPAGMEENSWQRCENTERNEELSRVPTVTGKTWNHAAKRFTTN